MISFPTHGTQRVFIVDDEPSLRDLFSVALEDASREVTTCGNGVTALKVLKKNKFDAILLDLSLPDIDGIHILGEMRKGGDKTDVILCSANVDEGSFHAAVELNVTGFISKPVTLAALRQIMGDVLAGNFDTERSINEFAAQFGYGRGKCGTSSSGCKASSGKNGS